MPDKFTSFRGWRRVWGELGGNRGRTGGAQKNRGRTGGFWYSFTKSTGGEAGAFGTRAGGEAGGGNFL